MKWVFNMVGTSVNSTRTVGNDARYISNQLDCHASRIDDNTRDLHELMEKVDHLKEDVQKLTGDPKTRSLLLYDVNMNCIKSMNEAHKSIRREPNSIDNTHIKTTS